MTDKSCSTGLDDRCRDANGEIRRKNGNTLLGSLRETYGGGFASGFRSNMKLETLLKITDTKSLSDYLKNRR